MASPGFELKTLRLLRKPSWGRHPKGQINKWPHKTLCCPAPRRLKPRYPDTRAQKADVFVGTSFVCLALVPRLEPARRPEWPPQEGFLNDLKVLSSNPGEATLGATQAQA